MQLNSFKHVHITFTQVTLISFTNKTPKISFTNISHKESQ